MTPTEYKADLNTYLADAARAVQSEDWASLHDRLTNALWAADRLLAREHDAAREAAISRSDQNQKLKL